MIQLVDKAPRTSRACRMCGCTDTHACEGGCFWVETDLCSACRQANPFLVMGVDDRLPLVKRFDADQCRAALGVDCLQETVRAALERRLRKLERAQ